MAFQQLYFIVGFISLIGPLFIDKTAAMLASPVVAGGAVAQIIGGVMNQKGLVEVEVLCVMVFVFQQIGAIPVTSVILKREAKRYIISGECRKIVKKL